MDCDNVIVITHWDHQWTEVDDLQAAKAPCEQQHGVHIVVYDAFGVEFQSKNNKM